MQEDNYIADDRQATPEYFEMLKNMTEEEFTRHIQEIKEKEE